MFDALSKPYKNSVKHSADDCILSLSVGTDFFNSLFFTSSACAEARPLRSVYIGRSGMFVCLFIAQALYQTKRKISLTLFDVPRAGGRRMLLCQPLGALAPSFATALSLVQSQSAPKHSLQYSQMVNFTPRRIARRVNEAFISLNQWIRTPKFINEMIHLPAGLESALC